VVLRNKDDLVLMGTWKLQKLFGPIVNLVEEHEPSISVLRSDAGHLRRLLAMQILRFSPAPE